MRGLLTYRWLVAVLLGCALFAGERNAFADGETKVATAAIGSAVKDLSFTDIRYLPRSFDELGERKALVVVFTTLECPLVQRYLPRLRELEAAYRERGVKFLALNVAEDDLVVDVAHQAVKADLPFVVGKDYDAAVAQTLGATRTPEAVVLDAENRIRYRGRIDDAVRLTGVRPKATREDLKEAIEDVLAGKDVRVATTPIDGCAIDVPQKVAASEANKLNYHEHIAPLVQKHCQDCHNDSGQAPFELLSYRDVAGRAETVAEVVRQGRMPPSFAAKEHGHFTNDRRMSDKDRQTLLTWLAGERAEGDEAKAPSPRVFAKTKWAIGQPDLVIKSVRKHKVPASGYVPYVYDALPYVFMNDTWVQKVEILPSNKRVVHHCNMGAIHLGKIAAGERIDGESAFITGYVPGGEPMVLDNHVGLMIPAGSMLVLQIHYVTTGAETTDQISVGITYAKERIDKRARHFQCSTSRFEIPPGAPHHPVKAGRTFDCNATGVGMFVHMHLRGKDMTYRAFYPDGATETLLSVPNYNFDWQMAYRWEVGKMKFPKGSRFECTAHYDNSAFNPFNPDPKKAVRHGQQTFQEMMFGFLFYTDDDEKLGLSINPKNGRVIE
jgi:thiol-disulfide isomerase/thioredoxin/mono/diheme cytochrome c family protein